MRTINITTEYKAKGLTIREERDKKNNTTDIAIFDELGGIVCSFNSWTEALAVARAIIEVTDELLDTHTEYGKIPDDEAVDKNKGVDIL